MQPQTRSARLTAAFCSMLIIGIAAFPSTSLLLHPEQMCSSRPTPKTLLHARRNSDLHVAADIFDPDFESSLEASGVYPPQDTASQDSDESKHILTFQSSFQRQAKSSVQLSPDIELDKFFLNTDHLLSAGKSVHSKIVPKTSELLNEWAIACGQVGACPPNTDKGVITSVRTAGITIPGLKVEWSAIIGTNLVYGNQYYPDRYHQHPELEFVLIKDETKASGAKPMLWIYNKLTRNRSQSQKEKGKRRSSKMDTKLFTRLGFYKEEEPPSAASNSSKDIVHGKNDSFMIRCDGTMEMKFRMPSMIGKLAFSSSKSGNQKAKAERNISHLITRQIEKDADQNIQRWEENFKTWSQEQDASNFVPR